jgi:hypothetical protein
MKNTSTVSIIISEDTRELLLETEQRLSPRTPISETYNEMRERRDLYREVRSLRLLVDRAIEEARL